MKIWKTGSVITSYKTTDIDSITFESKQDMGDGKYLINGHKFVDLGLPSGLLWAENNLGAETATDYGNYYTWGETEIYYEGKTYKYGKSYSDWTKYNTTDKKTVLDKEDDAAYVNWGLPCRMPTYDEFTELRNEDNCTWTWTSMTTTSGSSVNGYKVDSVKNGNWIFLPAAGEYSPSSKLSELGSVIYYWSSTTESGKTNYSCCIGHSDLGWHSFALRNCAFSIRPVTEP